MAEIINLPFSIPGVGREGDCIVHDPDNPDPRYRLVRVSTLDLNLLDVIRKKVAALGAKKP